MSLNGKVLMNGVRGTDMVKPPSEWEDTMEGVWDSIAVFQPSITYDGEVCKKLIAETLLKLPKKVRIKVLDNVVFIIVDDMHGTAANLYFTKSYEVKDLKRFGDRVIVSIPQAFILLNYYAMKKKSKFYKMSCIAHEIAHYMLGHHINPTRKCERPADDLTEKWGFRRAYKNKHYRQFESRPPRGVVQ